VLFVGVRCPIETIMQRRDIAQEGRETLYLSATEDVPVPEPVQRWQDEVHRPGIYDMEVDTSVLTPLECAEAIRHQLDLGIPEPSAFERIAGAR
jgi:chloramphenicol 3-O phosphotransferase